VQVDNPVPRLDTQALALMAMGLFPYQTVVLYCFTHGWVRVNLAVHLPVKDRHPCPLCNERRPCGVLPVVGYTRRPLPSYDIWFARIKWEQIAAEPEPPSAPEKELRQCEECGTPFLPTRLSSQRLCGDLCASIRASRRRVKARHRQAIGNVGVTT
jgi:hypothetical protein